MLNITLLVVPGQPNQITPFTSTASQHTPACRLGAKLLLILPEPWEQGRVSLDLRRVIGIPLRASGTYEKRMDSLRGGSWLIRAYLQRGSRRARRWITMIWGKATVKESEWGVMQGLRGDICQKAKCRLLRGVWSDARSKTKQEEWRAAKRWHQFPFSLMVISFLMLLDN